MSVLAVKTNSRFGRSPIIYFGIPGVPSCLPPIMTLVPCGVRCSWVDVPFSGLSQMFGWLISLTLIPVLDIHSSWVCYPYTDNISFLWCFPQWNFLLLLPRSQLVSLQWIYFPLEFFSPMWVLHSPVGFPVCFSVSLIKVVSCSRCVSVVYPQLESC